MIVKVSDVLPYISGEANLAFSTKDLQLVKELIHEIVGFISSYVGYDINEHTVEEITSGNGTDTVLLNEYIVNVQHLYIDPVRNFDSSTEISSDEFYVDPFVNGIKLRNSKFPNIPNSVKVVYTSGWTDSSIPRDLKSVICSTTANLFDKIRKKLTDVTSHAGLGSSVTYPVEKIFTYQHYTVLAKYKIPSI